MHSKPGQSPLVAGINQSVSAMGAPIADCQPHHDLPMDCKGSGSWRSALSPSLELRWKGGKCHRAGRDCIPDSVDISERPEEVDHRCRIGDWEGDTVKGGSMCFVTLTERFSRLFLCKRIERKTADLVSAAMVEMLRKVKGKLHTLTLDNGGEFAEHRKITTGVPVYFASPYASWQRGTNENSDGRLRRMWPKKFDISTLIEREIEDGLLLMNTTPRKILEGLTSWEVFTGKRVALIT